MYASSLLNNVKKNYTTTKKEVLAMVYAFHKYHHYLLNNKFVFYVNHMALLYLVKKPQVSSWIARWLLLVLKYNLSMVYKPGKSHSIANELSCLPKSNEPSEMLD
jgi:glutathionylspermidine synthase